MTRRQRLFFSLTLCTSGLVGWALFGRERKTTTVPSAVIHSPNGVALELTNVVLADDCEVKVVTTDAGTTTTLKCGGSK